MVALLLLRQQRQPVLTLSYQAVIFLIMSCRVATFLVNPSFVKTMMTIRRPPYYCTGTSIRKVVNQHNLLRIPQQQQQQSCLFGSVTGQIYSSEDDDNDSQQESSPVVVTLFTKEGCTLCDKVKDVLYEIKESGIVPHSLEQIDITDSEHTLWFEKYKYDIPILHINNQYWIKHRITKEEALKGLLEARKGIFQEQSGEPNAGAMERL